MTENHDRVPSARTLRTIRRGFEAAQSKPRKAETAAVTVLCAYMGAGIASWWATRPPTALAESALLAGSQPWSPTWAWAAAGIACAASLMLSKVLGVVTASDETLFWLLSAPVARAGMLRPAVARRLLLGAIIGAAGGRLVGFAGVVDPWAPLIGCGAAVGVAIVAITILAQCGVLSARVPGALAMACGFLGSSAAIAAAAQVSVAVVTTWGPVGVASGVAMALAATAMVWCGRMTTAQIGAGNTGAIPALVAVKSMDLSIFTGAVSERRWHAVAQVPSRRLSSRRPRALAHTDMLRHLRSKSSFGVAATAAGCTWMITSVAEPRFSAVTQLVAVCVVAIAFSTGLGELAASPELRSALGRSDRELYRPMMVVPAVAALAAMMLTAVAVGWNPLALLIISVGACGAAYRWRTRPPRSYGGAMFDAGFGQVPIDLIRQWLRGPDALALAAALLLLVL